MLPSPFETHTFSMDFDSRRPSSSLRVEVAEFWLSESTSLSTSRTMKNFFRLHVESSWMMKKTLTEFLMFVGGSPCR